MKKSVELAKLFQNIPIEHIRALKPLFDRFMQLMADPHVEMVFVMKKSLNPTQIQFYPIQIPCDGIHDDVGCIHKVKEWFSHMVESMNQNSQNGQNTRLLGSISDPESKESVQKTRSDDHPGTLKSSKHSGG